MKRTILFILVLTGLLLATVLTYQPLVPTNARAASSPPAGVPTVPLYRLFAPSTGIHFYTTDENRKQESLGSGWNSEGIAAHILNQQAPGTVPLFVLLEKLRFDHEEGNPIFGYTTSEQDKDQLLQNTGDTGCGYVKTGDGGVWHLDGNGIAGYIASTQLTGTVPLYHLYHPPMFGPDEIERDNPIQMANFRHFRRCRPSSYDAFYTINEAEKNKALSTYGYKFVRIEGYVWPQPATLDGTIKKTPKVGPGKPVGDADTVLLKWGCTRPASGAYNCPTIAGYEACENYLTRGDVTACSTSANQKVQAAMEKELFFIGCSRFLNRPDEFRCKTQKSFDLCETYRKNGTLKKCLQWWK